MNIALFGGTFDPIHRAHVALAEACREQLGLDEVWFLVTPQNPWKRDSHLTADEHRLRMVQMAIDGHPGLVASDYEFHLEKPTYSYLTLRHLRHDYPQHTFTLIIGGDNWAQFDHWANYEEILQHHPVAVYPRGEKEVIGNSEKGIEDMHRQGQEGKGNLLLPITCYLSDLPLLPISSTDIRRRIAEGRSVEGLIHPAVEQYIRDNGLYNSPPSPHGWGML